MKLCDEAVNVPSANEIQIRTWNRVGWNQFFGTKSYYPKLQSVYTKSGCWSPSSLQALNPPSFSLSAAVTYFMSSFERTPGRSLTLFLHDKYALLMKQPTITKIQLLRPG